MGELYLVASYHYLKQTEAGIAIIELDIIILLIYNLLPIMNL